MDEVSEAQVIDCLKALAIYEGDGLLIHSAVQFLGRPIGGVGMYLSALKQVIGADGTIAVPVFNFGFARGEPFDPDHTPSKDMGAFSEYVRLQPDARRTSHPMQSLAVIGCYTGDLAERDTPSAFDPGSAFERMLELNFKLLLLGADIRAVSITHYSEQRGKVPYRYYKNFSGQIRTDSGWQERTYRMFVRDLEMSPRLTVDHLQAELERRGLWASIPLNYGKITVCRLKDYVTVLDEFIAADPWTMVINRQECLNIYNSRQSQ